MSDQPNLVQKIVDQVQDAVGAAVGMASASTTGSHEARMFAANAAAANRYEIEAATLALSRVDRPDIVRMARTLLQDDGRAERILATRVVQAGVETPKGMDERRKGMIDNLANLHGEAFEHAFLRQQHAAQEEAVTLHEGFARDGDNPVLRGVASAMVPVVRQHLSMVRRVDATHAP